jgi:hypothetical protein
MNELPYQSAQATVLGGSPFSQMGSQLQAAREAKGLEQKEKTNKEFTSDLPSEIWMERDGEVFNQAIGKYLDYVSQNPTMKAGSPEWAKAQRMKSDLVQFGGASKMAVAQYRKNIDFVQKNDPNEIDGLEEFTQWSQPIQGEVGFNENGNLTINGEYFGKTFTGAPTVGVKPKEYNWTDIASTPQLIGKSADELGRYFKPSIEDCSRVVSKYYSAIPQYAKDNRLKTYIASDYTRETGDRENAGNYVNNVFSNPEELALMESKMLKEASELFQQRHSEDRGVSTSNNSNNSNNPPKEVFTSTVYTPTGGDGLTEMKGVVSKPILFKDSKKEGDTSPIGMLSVSEAYSDGDKIYVTGYRATSKAIEAARLLANQQGFEFDINKFMTLESDVIGEPLELSEADAKRYFSQLKATAKYGDELKDKGIKTLDDFKKFLKNGGSFSNTSSGGSAKNNDSNEIVPINADEFEELENSK